MHTVGMLSWGREQRKPFWFSQRASSSGYHWRLKIGSSKLSWTSNCWLGNINSAFGTRNSTTSPHWPGSPPQLSSYHSRSMLGIFQSVRQVPCGVAATPSPPTFYPRLLIFRDPCQDSQSLWNPLQSKFWKYALSMQLWTFLVKREIWKGVSALSPRVPMSSCAARFGVQEPVALLLGVKINIKEGCGFPELRAPDLDHQRFLMWIIKSAG